MCNYPITSIRVIAVFCDQKISIAGRYVLNRQGEDIIEADTVVITPLNEKAIIHYFVHHTAIQKKLNGKSVSEERKTNSSLCVYNADNDQITDQIYGNVYLVSEAELKLVSEEETNTVKNAFNNTIGFAGLN